MTIVQDGLFASTVAKGQEQWFFGPYGWILDEVTKLALPVHCKGALGIWKMPDDVIQRVNEQLQGTQ